MAEVERVEKVDFFLCGVGLVVAIDQPDGSGHTREILSTLSTFSTC
jgi:hypothetical protein